MRSFSFSISSSFCSISSRPSIRALVAASLIALAAGCSSAPVMNLEHEPIPMAAGSADRSLKDVERSILAACSRRGWVARPAGPGRIEASITIRTRHRASIEIAYTATDFSIRYVDSSGLDYKNGRIHRNYNRWVFKLSQTIHQEFGVKAQAY